MDIRLNKSFSSSSCWLYVKSPKFKTFFPPKLYECIVNFPISLLITTPPEFRAQIFPLSEMFFTGYLIL